MGAMCDFLGFFIKNIIIYFFSDIYFDVDILNYQTTGLISQNNAIVKLYNGYYLVT